MAIDDNTVYGLTGAQVKELPGKIEAVKGLAKVLTADDYNWPTTNPNGFALWKMEPGLYALDKDATTEMRPIYYVGTDVASRAVSGVDWTTYQGFILVPYRNGSSRGNLATFFSDQGTASFAVFSVDPTVYKAPVFVNNNLTSTNTTSALSANQGKVLNDKITPTSGSGAPTTATVGILGKIYIDTDTDTAYMCVKADTTTPEYTWKQITV